MKTILRTISDLAFVAVLVASTTLAATCYWYGGNDHCGDGRHDPDTSCQEDCYVTICDPNHQCVQAYAGFFTCYTIQSACSCATYRLQKHWNGNICTCGPEVDPSSVIWSDVYGTRSQAVVGDPCTAG
jgi:hypothetical protein